MMTEEERRKTYILTQSILALAESSPIGRDNAASILLLCAVDILQELGRSEAEIRAYVEIAIATSKPKEGESSGPH